MNAQDLIDLLERRVCFAGGGGGGGEFVEVIDNPYLPLMPGATYIYRGSDADGRALRSRVTVADEPTVIDGVAATSVRERKYAGGELVEDARRHYAQDQAGNVWQFDGSSRAIVMPARPAAASARALGPRTKVPFGTFADCVMTESPEAGQNYYAAGIGLIASQSTGGGEALRLAYLNLAPQSFADTVDNPYFPLTPGTTLIYRGQDNGTPVRQRVTITGETKAITGVATTVVRVREYADGELFEDTREYFAQDLAGNVWYFGEDSRQFDEGGAFAGADGSWLAGVDGAAPGIFMRARPAVGDRYQMEMFPGVAQDEAEVLATGRSIKVPYGTLGDVIHVLDFSLLEPDDVENKYYAPGIGFVLEEAGAGDDVENLRLAYVLIEGPQ